MISLRDILPEMYPHCGTELQFLADQNQGENPPPPEEVWDQLKQT
ncbi:hypothetical protein CKAH01_17788 [Colletotrichum kahawae]|uniref:Uncharacterized protein n=1 Tax=Colletotrichum kahawae TaxID=34407 RepID=A0AAD9Y931_COLKA|nr:hypothetical protein CKAH01_17788 [Colletotrichum kahawae]